MKSISSLAVSSLLLASVTIQSTGALKAYLSNLPNGNSFSKPLGHPNGDTSKFTSFAKAFQAVDLTWTTEFCKATFPGASMTNGEAFGDPCCTWKKGGTPDKTVTAFTTSPTTKTTCASGTAPAPAAGAGATSNSSTTDASAAETDAPSGGSSYTPAKVNPGSGGSSKSSGGKSNRESGKKASGKGSKQKSGDSAKKKSGGESSKKSESKKSSGGEKSDSDD